MHRLIITFDPTVLLNYAFHYRTCAKFLPVLQKIIELSYAGAQEGL